MPLPDLAELAQVRSVQLFVECAAAVAPGFSLLPANAPAVAAARCRLLEPTEFAANDQNFPTEPRSSCESRTTIYRQLGLDDLNGFGREKLAVNYACGWEPISSLRCLQVARVKQEAVGQATVPSIRLSTGTSVELVQGEDPPTVDKLDGTGFVIHAGWDALDELVVGRGVDLG